MSDFDVSSAVVVVSLAGAVAFSAGLFADSAGGPDNLL